MEGDIDLKGKDGHNAVAGNKGREARVKGPKGELKVSGTICSTVVC